MYDENILKKLLFIFLFFFSYLLLGAPLLAMLSSEDSGVEVMNIVLDACRLMKNPESLSQLESARLILPMSK